MMRIERRTWGRWLASFAGFPPAGLAAKAVVGPIDGVSAALLGGLAAGAVLGGAQALAHRAGTVHRVRWAVATAAGMAVGLAAGAGAVGYRTDTASLVTMGLLSGAGVGVLQAAVWNGPRARRVAWAVVTPLLWALGWFVTAQVIVDTDSQYANFGASGALLVAALSGLLVAASTSAGTSASTSAGSAGATGAIDGRVAR